MSLPLPPPRPDAIPAWRLLRAANLALALFALVTVAMAFGLFQSFDRNLLLALRSEDLAVPLGGSRLLVAMRDITALGGAVVLTMAMLIAAAILMRLGRSRLAALLIASNLLAQAASWSLKHVFDRPRPDLVPHLTEAFGAAYPSGHALMSAVVWLSLAGLGALLLRGRRFWILPAAAVLLVAAIGLSRVYLGVHWPSDVIAGWCFGSFWALATLALIRRLGLA